MQNTAQEFWIARRQERIHENSIGTVELVGHFTVTTNGEFITGGQIGEWSYPDFKSFIIANGYNFINDVLKLSILWKVFAPFCYELL